MFKINLVYNNDNSSSKIFRHNLMGHPVRIKLSTQKKGSTKHLLFLLSPLTSVGVVGAPTCSSVHRSPSVTVVCQDLGLREWFIDILIVWRALCVLTSQILSLSRLDQSRCPPIRWLAMVTNMWPM